MIKGFWQEFSKPIVGLSPMDGVTDAPMRLISKKYGLPDVIYTEFVSVDGLWRIHKRGETTHKIWNELAFDERERPVVAQLFGSDPDSFFEAAKIIAPMGFDGIDVNMGCPSPGLEKRGGGAGLMRDTGLARAVVEAVRKGAPDLPVSVKTRVGSTAPDLVWWKALADMELPALAMHGRTFRQRYSGEADWEVLKKASPIIKESGALFLGNGDVEKILPNSKLLLSGERQIDLGIDFDGVLVGRKAIGNPWALRKDGYEPSVDEKLDVAIEHAKEYERIFAINPIHSYHSPSDSIRTRVMERSGGTDRVRFEIMRKHLTCYAHGFAGAGGLRRRLVKTNRADEVEQIVAEFVSEYPDVAVN
jgi:tRNA-dihydrouridine synthase